MLSLKSVCSQLEDRNVHLLLQASTAKYHTLFLTDQGRAYVCGFGGGGRLGLGVADVCMFPRLIPVLSQLKCCAVVAAR